MTALPVDVRTRTTEDLLIFDITREVAEAVRESGVREGICCVYSARTNCAVRVNEFESGLLDDLASLFKRLVPDAAHESSNGNSIAVRDRSARCLSMLLGPAGETIPVANGELRLGTWQRVLSLAFDRQPRDERRWLVQVVGRADGPAETGS